MGYCRKVPQHGLTLSPRALDSQAEPSTPLMQTILWDFTESNALVCLHENHRGAWSHIAPSQTNRFSGFNFYVYTAWQFQLHQSIYCLGAVGINIYEPFIGSILKLLSGFLTHMR